MLLESEDDYESEIFSILSSAVRTREPTSFSRENAITGIVLLRVLAA